MDQFVNKVAESGIITLDLASYIPSETEIADFDLKPFLFREMILREKDYRAALPEVVWAEYTGKHVALFCSVDAIVPVWAFMLAASCLQPFAASVHFGSRTELLNQLIEKNIAAIDTATFEDKRVVIKGCGDTPIPDAAYVGITVHLRGVVKSLMYGEPCSTVPVYKKPAAAKIISSEVL